MLRATLIDDFGLKPLRAPADEDLHDLIAERYERVPTIVTSNLDFEEWDHAFATNRLLASATLDRLRHNSYCLELDGPSYRDPKVGPAPKKNPDRTPKSVAKRPTESNPSGRFSATVALAGICRFPLADLCRLVTYIRAEGYQSAVAPEVLFIQRGIEWLRPGGRMGIVLPDGILGNPGDEYIRRWILRHCWVLASVDLPVETFIVEANVNILTSLLFLKKKTREEIQAEDLGRTVDYPVFMAVAEKVGFDRRGVPLYERTPDGEEILKDDVETERIRVGGKVVIRTLHRKKKILDDDLPKITEAYREFRRKHPEPGE